MVQSVSTYSQAILSATYSGTYLSSSFTGKEKDFESGYHYFGARYYDSEALTGWLSVDPMMDKYPSLSPYNYCAWNPIKLVDPDGRKIRGVTYISERGEFHFTKSAIRCGTDKYVNALLKTNTGNKILMQLINSNKKYSVHVTNRHLFLMDDATGNYSQTSGLYLRKKKQFGYQLLRVQTNQTTFHFPIVLSSLMLMAFGLRMCQNQISHLPQTTRLWMPIMIQE